MQMGDKRLRSHPLPLPGGAVVKNLPANTGDTRDADSVPGLGRSPGGGHGYPLENSMNREAWKGMVHRVTKSQIRLKQLSSHALYHIP